MSLLNALMRKGPGGVGGVSLRRCISSTGTSWQQQSPKYWILRYTYDPKNLLERRAPWRPQHLALAEEYKAKGKILLGGAFADPIDGAMLVFKGEKSDVEEFVRRDVYVLQGVATDPVIREWTVVTGTEHKSS